jgi:hypothetical protein
MKCDPPTPESRDILSNRWITVAAYWLPALALVVSGFFDIGQMWRTAVWVVALATMGSACIVNAIRCGRVHCYVTGPFFLVMAIVTLLYGLGVAPLGARGWNSISLTVLVGAVLLYCLPEAFLGRYRHGRNS